MKRFLVCLLLLSGCAVPTRVGERKETTPLPIPAHPWRQMIVYVPQTDDAIGAWMKWFAKNPNLRMVIAMSPRFQRAAKDPHLKAQIQALMKSGRLELALQIPNAPLLPLLMEDPPYGYSDDVVQLIARSKAGFFRQWNYLPRGLVLPFGAASPKLISFLEKMGFSWIVAAVGAPTTDGPYQSGPLMIWDATPAGRPGGTTVRIWDEREMKDRPLDGWMLEMGAKSGVCLLPQDPGIVPSTMNVADLGKPRAWAEPDLSTWVGHPAKNANWSALRKTREALEGYKNSGQASVSRLDAAFEEIYGAQNSNFFASAGNAALSPALVEERQHEFQASLSAVYRIIGRPVPEDLFGSAAAGMTASVRQSSTTARAEKFPDGREHVLIVDAAGDPLVPGGPDVTSLDVSATTMSIHWAVTVTTGTAAVIDIYMDLNGQPNAGTPAFLTGRPYVASPNDAWEYAISISGQNATLYRTQGSESFGVVQTFPVVIQGNTFDVDVPRDILRGSPSRWGYQVLVMTGDPQNPAAKAMLSDFIDPLEISQKDLWQDLSSGKRNDIPFIRVRNK